MQGDYVLMKMDSCYGICSKSLKERNKINWKNE